jgi:hypothetical protein
MRMTSTPLSRRRFIAGFVSTAALSRPAERVALAQQVLITGIGRMSCAHWLSQSVNEGEGWILGFWSGLNYANTRTVGQRTDGEGIITEVRKACATRPSMTLVGATFTVYSEMASK